MSWHIYIYSYVSVWRRLFNRPCCKVSLSYCSSVFPLGKPRHSGLLLELYCSTIPTIRKQRALWQQTMSKFCHGESSGCLKANSRTDKVCSNLQLALRTLACACRLAAGLPILHVCITMGKFLAHLTGQRGLAGVESDCDRQLQEGSSLLDSNQL